MKFPKTETGCRLWANVCTLYGIAKCMDSESIYYKERVLDLLIELEETAEGHKQSYEAMKQELEIAIKHVDAKKMFPQFFGIDKGELNKSCYTCGYKICNISNDSKIQYCNFWKEEACKK